MRTLVASPFIAFKLFSDLLLFVAQLNRDLQEAEPAFARPTTFQAPTVAPVAPPIFDRPSIRPPTVPTIQPPSGSCADPGGVCSICGPGRCVGSPTAMFSLPGSTPIACGFLEDAASQGLIPPFVCPLFADLVDGPCGCRHASDGCSVCGDGLRVGNPNAIFAFPGNPPISCGLLEEAGFQGQISLDVCGWLPVVIGNCECQSGPPQAPVASPINSPYAPTRFQPTFQPVAPSPVAAPIPPSANVLKLLKFIGEDACTSGRPCSICQGKYCASDSHLPNQAFFKQTCELI
jgi:hypothetical protein